MKSSPYFCTAAADETSLPEMPLKSGPYGASYVNLMVMWSSTVVPLMGPNADAPGDLRCGSTRRSMMYFSEGASTAVPSLFLSPARTLKVTSLLSGESCQLSKVYGTYERSGALLTYEVKTRKCAVLCHEVLKGSSGLSPAASAMISRPPGCGVSPVAAAAIACGVEVAGRSADVGAAAEPAPVVAAPAVVGAAVVGAVVPPGFVASGFPPQAARIAPATATAVPPTNARRLRSNRRARIWESFGSMCFLPPRIRCTR